MAAGNFRIINAKFTHKNIPIHKLEKFSLRQIDIFLWLTGKEYFPKKYK